MKKHFTHSYHDIISLENLLEVRKEFICGKRKRADVRLFERHLMKNILLLHAELVSKMYTHSPYQAFNISDPKPRNIHKAAVRDRLLHHALYRKLYPFFDKTFIADSYSCRKGKGTHKALNRFRSFGRETSKNNTRTCWILKCDIKKFFANIDHEILLDILATYIQNKDIIWLLQKIISSFEARPDVGLPLGNLTSQLLVNIYMNEFDQFVKHKIKARYYIRYADDFVILSRGKEWPENILPRIRLFLCERLRLELHPNKVSIRTLASCIGFLGWVHFPDHRVLRTSTKKRMLKRVKATENEAVLISYKGLLAHGNTYKLQEEF